jgi:ABC-type Fe3+ transport system permease subunit
MIISAWDIYLVMQLDSFNAIACIAWIMMAIVVLVSLVIMAFNTNHDYRGEKQAYDGGKNIVKWLSGPLVFFLILNTILPSSKTAAAMIVIPAVLNNQSVQTEAKELYTLAKQGFADMVKAEVVEAAKVSTPAEETTEE